MDVILKVMKGSKIGAKIAVKKDEFLIGRSPECHLCSGSTSISRKHCAIRRSGTKVTIADLGSRNGTLVNGAKITDVVELTSGDTLNIGNLEFLVTLTSGLNNEKKPQVKSVAEAAQRTASQGTGSDIGDDDISRWLLDSSQSGEGVLSEEVAETQTIRLDDTKASELRDAVKEMRAEAGDRIESSPETEDHKSAHSEEDVKDSGKKKKPGKLPPIDKKPSSKNSVEAAADALRSWSRRR
ncbi:FHA domain-containing protein [Bythopirellula polymerisocia]|uniref:Glycogen accumulation regulator GarA n=1 Tax=Bythopirellula polymerisocia TaxID=2528003 RepID=A0A5C6CHR8_9BACT|nr:FHA domain-containing protein [Bythopirellula polymerisocia]TWU22766.1 Glycogen accumulation regulator GarA [Bythopirellula polymerisocia]